MVNAYTEFRRVEQELSLYGHISGMGERNGARERRERRTRDEESGRSRAAKRARESRNSVFNINLRPRSARRGRASARWIKLGILRKETRPHIRRIVIRPLHVLLPSRRHLELSSLALRDPWFLPRNAPRAEATSRSCGDYPGGRGQERRRKGRRVLSGKYLFPSPKRFPSVPFRGMRGREWERRVEWRRETAGGKNEVAEVY